MALSCVSWREGAASVASLSRMARGESMDAPIDTRELAFFSQPDVV
jgi:hypothetical protein